MDRLGKMLNLCRFMHTLHPYSIFHLGDSALTVDFGDGISDALNKKVLKLFHYLQTLHHPFITDVIPAFNSLTVCYDVIAIKKTNPSQTAFDTMSELISAVNLDDKPRDEARRIEIPVCYSKKFALDYAVFEEQGLSIEEVVDLHVSSTYRVYMIGFLPGFAYMAEVHRKLEVPRKEAPRHEVAPGSVGIAGRQTGIYPLHSPGGWQIIGRTPLQLFDREREEPVLLRAGDEVQFYSISENEFFKFQQAVFC